MHYTVYKTINILNGKTYIGKHQTKKLDDGYLGSGKLLKQAIEKYGAENFIKEILYDFDNEADMNAKEAELVTEEFCARDDTYNICAGGKGGFGYINEAGLNNKKHEHVGRMTGDKMRGRRSVSQIVCMVCGKEFFPRYSGERRYCSLSCSASQNNLKRRHTQDTKEAIRASLLGRKSLSGRTLNLRVRSAYELHPNKCKVCKSALPYENRWRATCDDHFGMRVDRKKRGA